ncbi:MAG: bifunctional hydroxymethylpyrimidine kinase/phosphomethylpyrimidine kinase [Acidobacteria bacterium]|nr:bifunctional hydroxymethylpyrimidine kinase/phosphomethylpyrimidine kinase [Acidobacteriota bacterium]
MRTGNVPAALTIAGSDPSGGAGLQADLETFAAHGVHGCSAVTAVTSQNTVGITGSVVLGADLVGAQIEAIAADIPIRAVKTGMLGAAAVVEAVAAAIGQLDLPQVVVDPVMVSSSGTRLLDADGVQMLRAELLPRALVVTPNVPEAEVLSGVAISSPRDAQEAARRIQGLGCSAVIVTGGHAPGDEVVDLLFDGRTFHQCRTLRMAAPGGVHGTGCTFAAAVAANLALGCPLLDAAARAQAYVAGAIAHARAIGRGAALLDHFWRTSG